MVIITCFVSGPSGVVCVRFLLRLNVCFVWVSLAWFCSGMQGGSLWVWGRRLKRALNCLEMTLLQHFVFIIQQVQSYYDKNLDLAISMRQQALLHPSDMLEECLDYHRLTPNWMIDVLMWDAFYKWTWTMNYFPSVMIWKTNCRFPDAKQSKIWSMPRSHCYCIPHIYKCQERICFKSKHT